METITTEVNPNRKKNLTPLQQNEVQLTGLRVVVLRIGINWISKASGLSEQTITNFCTAKHGSKSTQTAIIETLGRALELKQKAQRDADIETFSLISSIRDVVRQATENQKPITQSAMGLPVCDSYQAIN